MVKQIFEGIKIADFSRVGTGPATVAFLSDHGATTIKIESVKNPDLSRVAPPFKDSRPGVNRTGWHNELNRNKYSLTINLRHPAGLELAKRIVAWADIVAENFPPGTMERLGLSYDEVRKIKPDIIMFSTSMQGQTGPYAEHPGYGVMLTGLAGFTNLTGWPDRGPVEVYGAYTDWILPPAGAVAILAALDYKRRTGCGQHLDVAQFEVGLNFIAPTILDYTVNGRIWRRMGNRSTTAAPHGVYRCRGKERWCAISVHGDAEWSIFKDTIGNPMWANDNKFDSALGRKSNEDELERLIEAYTINFNSEELMTRLQGRGISAGLVETGEDLVKDQQLNHNAFWWRAENPEIGEYIMRGRRFQLSKTPCELRMRAPCLGEHNEYVCTEILGLSDEEFIRLLQEEVLE